MPDTLFSPHHHNMAVALIDTAHHLMEATVKENHQADLPKMCSLISETPFFSQTRIQQILIQYCPSLQSISFDYPTLKTKGEAVFWFQAENEKLEKGNFPLFIKAWYGTDNHILTKVDELAKSNLNSVSLRLCNLTNIDVESLVRLVTNPQSKITSLDLFHNQITARGAVLLAEAIANPDCKITYINLAHNKIGSEGLIAMMKAYRKRNIPFWFPLDAYHFIEQDADTFAEAIIFSHPLHTSLDLSSTSFDLATVEKLIPAVTHPNSQITSLNLQHCNLLSNLDLWVEGLLGSKITTLNLSGADLSSLNPVAKFIRDPQSHLTHCDLSFVKNLKESDIQLLAKALSDPNNQLTHLNLKHCKLSAAQIQIILKALQNPHCKITSIQLNGNEFNYLVRNELNRESNYEACEALRLTLLAPTCKITSISLDSTAIGDRGMVLLANAIIENPETKLTSIVIENTENQGQMTLFQTDAVHTAMASAIQVAHSKLEQIQYKNYVAEPIQKAINHNYIKGKTCVVGNMEPSPYWMAASDCKNLKSPQLFLIHSLRVGNVKVFQDILDAIIEQHDNINELRALLNDLLPIVQQNTWRTLFKNELFRAYAKVRQKDQRTFFGISHLFGLFFEYWHKDIKIQAANQSANSELLTPLETKAVSQGLLGKIYRI